MMISVSPSFFDFCGKHRAKFLARLGRDAAGAAVGDNSLLRRAWQKFARAHTSPGFKFHAQAERFDDAAADLKFQRVVAEQARDARARCRA